MTVDFLDRDSMTEVVLTHEGLSSPEQRALAEGGWPTVLDALTEVVTSTLLGE